jgi:hypothetical protein
MTAAVLVLMGLWAVGLSAAAQENTAQENASQDSPILKDFQKRVADYVKLHKIARSEVHGLKPTTSAEEIEHHEHRLAKRLRESGREAVQGNIFTTGIAAEFRRLIGVTMRGPEADRIRESLRRAAPVHLSAIRVNQTYPAGVPLQSTPPSLLLNLPPLPPELEYRLVGRALILRDIEANLIVDFIPDAVP